MKILAIGGSGFIGHNLVQEMVAGGHDVTVLGRRPEPVRPLPPSVAYVQGSLDNRALLLTLLDGVDAVAHLASSTVPSTGDKDPIADVQTNLIGTLTLLGAMTETGCKRLLFVSSGGTVYGVPQSIPIDETERLTPICSYGIVKVGIESYLELYARNTGLSYVTIRASNPYGPHQGSTGLQGVIGTFLQRALDEKPIEIWGDGSTIRDYIFVADLCHLCMTAIASPRIGTYNGASGHGTSVQHIADVVREVTGRQLDIIYRPGRLFDVPTSILGIDKARHDFNWKPTVGLREGVSLTWRWLTEGRRG
ncbi:MAG: NAD-dependent epimerase/dehydratase family protein [Paracoccaceae bacterium]